VATNPANIGVQVSGLSGATFSYYYLGALQNGTPVLGNVIGTKKYAASQTVNSVESDTASFNVTILDPANLIHLQKIVDSGILQSNSTFNYPFTLVVSNLTNTTFTNIVLTDNLQNSVPLTSEYSIVKNTANGGLKANSSFNGNSDINVTLASSTLAPQAKDTAKFTMNLVPKGYSGNLTNVAYVKANTKWGTIIMQSSSSTKANETTKLPTKYYVKDLSISIPEGFSPNHDGVHDNFVIIKPYNITLDLEVFNRWGNVVYSSSNYKNDWDGRGTGNFAGQDLVDGGYYYSLRAVDETGKVQVFKGFVIIQR
jgi:gliding motility-associated-like protein